MPSSTTRCASRTIAKYTRFATNPHCIGLSFTTIGCLPQRVAASVTVAIVACARLGRHDDLGELHHRRGRRPVPADDAVRPVGRRPRARRSASPRCSTRGSSPAARAGRGRGTRGPSARAARARLRSRDRSPRPSSNDDVNVMRANAGVGLARASPCRAPPRRRGRSGRWSRASRASSSAAGAMS